MDFVFQTPPPALYLNNLQNVSSKTELVRFCSNLLKTEGLIITENRYYSCVMEREEMGPTLLNDNLAIPHGQDECVLQPSLCVCLLAEPFLYQTSFNSSYISKVFLFSLPKPFDNSSPEGRFFQAFSVGLVNPTFTNALTSALTYREFRQHVGQHLRLA